MPENPHDRERTQLQEEGKTFVGGLSLAQVMAILTDLGLNPSEAWLDARGNIRVKGQ